MSFPLLKKYKASQKTLIHYELYLLERYITNREKACCFFPSKKYKMVAIGALREARSQTGKLN